MPSPAGSMVSASPTQVDHSSSFIRILTGPVLCLDISRRTDPHPWDTVAHSAQYSDVLYRRRAQGHWAVPSSPGVQEAAPSRCGRAPDLLTRTESPNAALRRTDPRR